MRFPVNSNRYSAVTSTLALVIALGGGTAYAAGLVGSKDIKDGGVKRVDIAKGAVDSKRVADGTLLASDFKAGQLPAGTQGAAGPQGLAGPPGPTGAMGARGPEGPEGPKDRKDRKDRRASLLPSPMSTTVAPARELNTNRSWGVAGVRQPFSGVFCVQLDYDIPRDYLAPIAAPNESSFPVGSVPLAVVEGPSGTCGADSDEVAVRTYRVAPGAAPVAVSDMDFTLVVP